ncbi:hypothetical protein J1N35_025402, partial [Gossypium stocksii]
SKKCFKRCRVFSSRCHLINVRSVSLHEVHGCIDTNARSLNFPFLITALCRADQVPLHANEDVTPNKGGMFRFIGAKVQSVETPRSHQQSSAPTSAAKQFAQVEASTL